MAEFGWWTRAVVVLAPLGIMLYFKEEITARNYGKAMSDVYFALGMLKTWPLHLP